MTEQEFAIFDKFDEVVQRGFVSEEEAESWANENLYFERFYYIDEVTPDIMT